VPSETATLRPHSPDRPRLRFQWWWIALVVVVIMTVVLLARASENPSTIGHVTFVNPTQYALDVEVAGANKNSWTDLGTAERERTTVVNDVIDQGETWIVRVGSQGAAGGELRLSRDALQRAGWKVEIPESVGTRLATEGAAPTPPPGF
jgi:hypothetical protein